MKDRDGKGRFIKGKSGNPAGRVKDDLTWAGVVRSVGEMYPGDILEFIGRDNPLGQMLAELPRNVQLKYLITARVFAALMFEPSAGLWNALMDRADGKVSETYNVNGNVTWKEFIDATKPGADSE